MQDVIRSRSDCENVRFTSFALSSCLLLAHAKSFIERSLHPTKRPSDANHAAVIVRVEDYLLFNATTYGHYLKAKNYCVFVR